MEVCNDRDQALQTLYFRSSIDEIKTRQLRLGRAMARAGADLSKITSLVQAPAQQVVRTYVGGGTPCW